jgi:hypothetical protein
MRPEARRALKEGVVAGLILYAAVAGFFIAVNLLGGRPAFHTAGLLGEALFGGLRDPGEATLDPGWIVGYNAVHLVVSLILGTAASFIVALIDTHRLAWYGFFFLFLATFVMSLLLMGVLTVELAGVLRWHSVVTGHLAGGVVTWGYLAWAHAEELPALSIEEE